LNIDVLPEIASRSVITIQREVTHEAREVICQGYWWGVGRWGYCLL